MSIPTNIKTLLSGDVVEWAGEKEKRDLYTLANNIPLDDRVNHFAEIDDLNITLIQQYLHEAGSSL